MGLNGTIPQQQGCVEMLSEIIDTIMAKDPAVRSRFEVIFCYPGFQACALHSVAHKLYLSGHYLLARFISNLGRNWTGIEIHPGAKLGRRLFIDHGMGTVIGETAIVGDDVVIYQGVTLGAGAAARMGAETRGVKRHPTIGNNVVVGSGSEIQGDITVGDNSRVASMTIVLKDVPPNCVVVGVPGRIIQQDGRRVPHELTDFEAEAIKSLQTKLTKLTCEFTALKAQLDAAGTGAPAETAGGNGSSPPADKRPLDMQPQLALNLSVKPESEVAEGPDPVDLFLHGAGI
jgi:serine O-acetyltransferase